MNSGKLTDEFRGESRTRRRVRRKRGSVLKPILLGLAVICLAVLACFGLAAFRQRSIDRPYDDLRLAAAGSRSSEPLMLTAFASDLSVVGERSDEDTVYRPLSGLLIPRGGGTSVYAKEVFTRRDPASTTKIMTALLALKYGNLQDIVTVTDDCVINEAGASLANLHPGDRISLEQLLYGLMLPSGNDAANAIAVHLGGSLEGFADMMNREAQALGALGTHFVNANGLTAKEHYTTAYDLYLIMNEALQYPEFRNITGSAQYTAYYEDANGKTLTRTWKNGNRYISGTESPPETVRVFAGKTGTTMAAGNCLVLGAENGAGEEYISVVLKAAGREELYQSMSYLLQQTEREKTTN